jgi:hypothetical protein
MNIYLVFSMFASRPTSLLASNRASVFFLSDITHGNPEKCFVDSRGREEELI